MSTIGRDCLQSWSPRPPEMRSRVSARFESGACRRGIKRWRVARGWMGKIESKSRGAREMKVRI